MKRLLSSLILVLLVPGTSFAQELKPNVLDKPFNLKFLEGVSDESLKKFDVQFENENWKLKQRAGADLSRFHRRNMNHEVLLAYQMKPGALKSWLAERRADSKEKMKSDGKFLQDFSAYLKSIEDVDSFLVFEGLPRLKGKRLEDIKQKNDTLEIGGWSFFAKPLEVSDSTADLLRWTLVDFKSFEPYGGPKFCGGFHPDFCVEWEVGGEKQYMQICFGCEEALLLYPDKKKVVFDFNERARTAFAHFAISNFERYGEGIRKVDELYFLPTDSHNN